LTWNVVTDAPCQEIVLQGAALDRPGAALDGIPGADLDPGLGQRTQPTAHRHVRRRPGIPLEQAPRLPERGGQA
jgi:hypothetical protein